jgi:hypothetical protein
MKYALSRLMIGILAACILAKGIFWIQKPNVWLPKRNPRNQVNLLTRAETFQFLSLHLYYLIFEGSTVLLDHLFDPQSRLYFALLTSAIMDVIVLILLPSLVLHRSRTNYPLLWAGRKMAVKQSDFAIISGSVEPRRDITIVKTKPKRKKRVFHETRHLETIEELPNIEM